MVCGDVHNQEGEDTGGSSSSSRSELDREGRAGDGRSSTVVDIVVVVIQEDVADGATTQLLTRCAK